MLLLKKFILVTFSLACLSSCAKQISSDFYSSRSIGEASTTYIGTIRNIRQVRVGQSSQLDQNTTGIVSGGILGGAIGGAASRGNVLPVAAGAIAGAFVGSLIEKDIKNQMALEYIIEMNDGRLITIVQGTNNYFYVNQPVYVIISPSGHSRIVPR